jgi:hypothetical protein
MQLQPAGVMVFQPEKCILGLLDYPGYLLTTNLDEVVLCFTGLMQEPR